jgi:hypothetical protein
MTGPPVLVAALRSRAPEAAQAVERGFALMREAVK